MANRNTKIVEVVSGTVEQINAKRTGIKVAGEWLNISQYHPIAAWPDLGKRVDAQVERTDRGAWISSLNVVNEHTIQPASERGREIRRLACLKAAAMFAAGKCLGGANDIRTADVLKVAEAFEQWVVTD
jgi:hypothetical protein